MPVEQPVATGRVWPCQSRLARIEADKDRTCPCQRDGDRAPAGDHHETAPGQRDGAVAPHRCTIVEGATFRATRLRQSVQRIPAAGTASGSNASQAPSGAPVRECQGPDCRIHRGVEHQSAGDWLERQHVLDRAVGYCAPAMVFVQHAANHRIERWRRVCLKIRPCPRTLETCCGGAPSQRERRPARSRCDRVLECARPSLRPCVSHLLAGIGADAAPCRRRLHSRCIFVRVKPRVDLHNARQPARLHEPSRAFILRIGALVAHTPQRHEPSEQPRNRNGGDQPQ